jgi:hypothetical protein
MRSADFGFWALFGPRAMSDVSPLCPLEQIPANISGSMRSRPNYYAAAPCRRPRALTEVGLNAAASALTVGAGYFQLDSELT